MTQREIETLAAAYSNSRPADEMPCNPWLARMIAADYTGWLLKDYCIIRKEEI